MVEITLFKKPTSPILSETVFENFCLKASVLSSFGLNKGLKVSENFLPLPTPLSISALIPGISVEFKTTVLVS